MSFNPDLSTPVTELLAGDISSTPVTVEEWSGEALINDEWSFWEPTTFELEGREVDVIVNGHGSIVLVRDEAGRTFNPNDSDSVDEYKESTRHQDDDEETLTDVHALTDDELSALESAEGYELAEGPMMSYWYPCPTVEDDPEAAALAIAHLSLCVVEIDGQGWGLALTGGGMDFSWEITEAFCRLGMLPPVHFSDLPRMGWGKSDDGATTRRYVVGAMLRSLEVTSERAQWARERLTEHYADLLTA